MDAGGGQVVSALERGHRLGLRRPGHREDGEAGRIDRRQGQGQPGVRIDAVGILGRQDQHARLGLQGRGIGKERCRVAVGAHAQVDQVDPRPGHEVRHGVLVGLDAFVHRPDRRHGREGPDPAHRVDEGLPYQPLVGVDIVGRDDALVPDVHVHHAPVDAVCRRQPLVARLGGRAAGEHQREARPRARREGLADRVAEGAGDVVDRGDHATGWGSRSPSPAGPIRASRHGHRTGCAGRPASSAGASRAPARRSA